MLWQQKWWQGQQQSGTEMHSFHSCSCSQPLHLTQCFGSLQWTLTHQQQPTGRSMLFTMNSKGRNYSMRTEWSMPPWTNALYQQPNTTNKKAVTSMATSSLTRRPSDVSRVCYGARLSSRAQTPPRRSLTLQTKSVCWLLSSLKPPNALRTWSYGFTTSRRFFLCSWKFTIADFLQTAILLPFEVSLNLFNWYNHNYGQTHRCLFL